MDLKAAVDRYLEVVKDFQRPMPLSRFGLSKEELESMVSGWEEDYQMNRHFKLIGPADELRGMGEDAVLYVINGMAYSAIVFKDSIRHVFD